MDPATATVEDLLQAPVLYISGSQALELLPHAKKLRDYVDRGGFIFAEACCGDSHRFDEGFRQLMAAVFPEPEYKLQQVTPGHPLWRHARHGAARFAVRRPAVVGVEYGCRTCVVYSTEDLVVLLGTGPARPADEVSRGRRRSTSTTRSRSASTCSPTPPIASRRARNKASSCRSAD